MHSPAEPYGSLAGSVPAAFPFRRLGAALSVVGLLLAALPAQQVPEGLAARIHSLPPAAGNVLALPNQQFVYFDGQDLQLQVPHQPPTSVLHLPLPVFGSFAIDAGAGRVLFGESSTNSLWLVPLNAPAAAQPLAYVTLNYDAVLLSPNRALVSARTGGWSAPDNDLVVVDLTTGALQAVAQLPGASGPVALAPNGDLYYATSSPLFPTPAGQTTVLRFRRPVLDQAIQQQLVLGLAQAEVVFAGLDSASDLCFDDDGDLMFVDWWRNAIGELNDAGGPAPWRTDLLVHGPGPLGGVGLQFLPAGAGGLFEPFQPRGGELLVHESSFGAVSQIRAMVAAQPTLATAAPSPVPAGAFTITASGGPANGFGLLALALQAPQGSPALWIPGFEQPLVWDLSVLQAVGTQLVAFDGFGTATVGLVNPGIASPLTITAQVAFVSVGGAVIGATAPLAVLLGP